METQKIIAGIVAGGTLVMGGVDASVLNETAIQRVETVAHERVEAKQIGNVVETTLTWKGENGLKVKYDMGEPTASEKIKDKRDKQVITERVDFADDGGFKIDIILDKKPDTNVFCYTIEGAENYDFWYQPALTQQEIDEGTERPDNIIGSYAVYHKTLRNHEVDKTNYETGKVMHIPRPQVWEVNDKENTTIWADLSYNEGQLCVTVDNNYLQKAKYPVRVDPTFGYTSVGATAASIGAVKAYSKGTTVEAGTITQMSQYTYTSSGSGNVGSALYSNTSSLPDVLLASHSATGTYTTTQQWVNTTISYAVSSGTVYWLASWRVDGAGTERLRADSLTNGSRILASGTPFSWDDPVTGTSNSNFRYSIYATYTAGGGGGGGETKQDSDFWFE